MMSSLIYAKTKVLSAIVGYFLFYVITLTDVADYVKIFSGLAVGGYAVYQWVSLYKKNNTKGGKKFKS